MQRHQGSKVCQAVQLQKLNQQSGFNDNIGPYSMINPSIGHLQNQPQDGVGFSDAAGALGAPPFAAQAFAEVDSLIIRSTGFSWMNWVS